MNQAVRGKMITCATERIHNPKFTAAFPAIPGLRSRFEGKARGRLQEQGLGTVLGAGSWEAQGEEAPRKKRGRLGRKLWGGTGRGSGGRRTGGVMGELLS